MYFLTIAAKNSSICERVPYSDFGEAILACGNYYQPRFPGSVLDFTSEVVGKKFARAYAQLTLLEDLPPDTPRDSPQGIKALKQGNAFIFEKSYTFLIESEAGVKEADRFRAEDNEE